MRARRSSLVWFVGISVVLLMSGCSGSTSPSDNDPPEPGNAGLILFVAVQPTTCTLLWSPAADNRTDAEDLEYKLVRSSSANVDDEAAAEANGTVIRDWVAGAAGASDTGLTPGATYYYNVLVRDEAENVAAYVMTSRTMPLEADNTAPTPGGGGSLTFTNVTPATVSLSWSPATDDRSAATDIRYQLVRSTAPNISDVTDAVEFGEAVYGYNWATNVSAATDTGLTPDTVYYYNLLARDEAGNMAAYSMVSEPTIGTDKIYYADLNLGEVGLYDFFTGKADVLVELDPAIGTIGVAVDATDQILYVSTHSASAVHAFDLQEPHSLIALYSTGNPTTGIALDTGADYLYWATEGAGTIGRSDLATGSQEVLVGSGLTQPIGVALDTTGGKIYWADYMAGKVQRADLDGSNVEDIVTGLLGPSGVAVDDVAGKVYWADNPARSIGRSNLDGSSAEDLITTVIGAPYGLAIDQLHGKIYFTESFEGTIKRADLDGSNIELVMDGMDFPTLIFLELHTWAGGGG